MGSGKGNGGVFFMIIIIGLTARWIHDGVWRSGLWKEEMWNRANGRIVNKSVKEGT